MLAERGDRRVNEIGLHLPEVVVAEAQAVHRTHAEVLGHHVRVADELLEQPEPLGRLELERDAELVPLAILRGWSPLRDTVARALDAEGYALAAPVPRLDLDDARAHVGEQHRAEGHGDDLTEIEPGEVVQREIHVSSWGAGCRRYCAGSARAVKA